MNVLFGEWYRSAELEPKNGELELRWLGVEKHRVTIDTAFGVDVVRLFLGISEPADEFISQFRQPFFDADSSGFRMSGNGLELRVLAGAVLFEILGRKDAYSDGIALLLIAAAAPELRKKATVLKDILTSASNHLFDRSTSVRRVGIKAKVSFASIETELGEMVQLASTNPAGIWKPAETALRQTAENISKLSNYVDGRFRLVQQHYENISEEANIVWWLFAGANRETLEAYSGDKPVTAALSSARDLASLTLVLPPPLAASAYLERCLSVHPGATAGLEDLGAAHEFSEHLDPHDLFPITSLLRAVAQGKPAKGAATVISKAFSLASAKFPIKTIALQFYREILAQRLLERKA
jgi:hypothetical protein